MGTLLYQAHQELAATLAEEYHAAREVVALRDASTGGRLRLKGADALDLLDRLSSNNLNVLQPGQAANTVLTSNKGRVLDHLRVHRLEDHLLVYTGPQNLQKVVDWIDLYTFIEEITATDITSQTAVLQLLGPRAPAFLESLSNGTASLEDGHLTQGAVADTPATIARNDFLGVLGYDLIVPAEEAPGLWEGLLERGEPWGLCPLGEEAFEVLRIEEAVPLYGRELSEGVNPLEAGLRPSISFTKGCFIGQEVVLRLDTYHKVQRHLVRLELEGDGMPERGERLLVSGKAVGSLTSVAQVPTDGRIVALGLLRTRYDQPGQVVEVSSQSRRWEGRVISLEQYAREGSGT